MVSRLQFEYLLAPVGVQSILFELVTWVQLSFGGQPPCRHSIFDGWAYLVKHIWQTAISTPTQCRAAVSSCPECDAYRSILRHQFAPSRLLGFAKERWNKRGRGHTSCIWKLRMACQTRCEGIGSFYSMILTNHGPIFWMKNRPVCSSNIWGRPRNWWFPPHRRTAVNSCMSFDKITIIRCLMCLLDARLVWRHAGPLETLSALRQKQRQFSLLLDWRFHPWWPILKKKQRFVNTGLLWENYSAHGI